ncbi:DNA adenine methylase [Protofrankia coriariae]|uniref:DNA adenine methylase n=1 Tax=Protofrankia coriariae TaxID=1562887 RepID=UPI000A323CDE
MSSRRSSGGLLRRPIISPLRYPGGKASLYLRLADLIRSNRLSYGTYVEPYAGGAGAALALLVTGQVRRIVINDLDPAVYAFWRALKEDPESFSRRIENVDLSVGEWRKQKEIQTSVDRSDFQALGFSTFYLNRTNRSGVLNGGPIGGLDQSGPYKIDARFNRSDLVERVRLFSLHSKRITVLNLDGREVIRRYSPRDDVFVYADPPYFEKAGSLYLNSFSEADHAALAKCLNSRASAIWLLTYDNSPKVAELYPDRRRTIFSLNYSAHRIARAKEVMVYSDALALVASQQALWSENEA